MTANVCPQCAGPSLSWKGSIWGWTCRACLADLLDAAERRFQERGRQERGRRRPAVELDGRSCSASSPQGTCGE
ncbi:MAG TPA: hypothetical protein VMU34_05170 [Mycobacterium sp.]|nr:hypothetical protein [Mycobacterium sp.]